MKKRNPIVFLTATVTFIVLLVMGGSTLLLALALEEPPDYHSQWGSQGSGDGEFQYPFGVAVDNSGNVYVADAYNRRIQKFDSNGVFLTKWGSEGSGDGEFLYPYDAAVDNSGNVYVADTFSHRIQKFGVAPPQYHFFLPSIINAPTLDISHITTIMPTPTYTPTPTIMPTDTATPTPMTTPTNTPT